MNENIFTVEIGHYGFMLDTEWCYIALSWRLLITSALLFIGYKVYKRYKRNRVDSTNEANRLMNEWITNEQTTNYTSAISPCRSRPNHGAHDVA